jgi:uncharacterized membrane protein
MARIGWLMRTPVFAFNDSSHVRLYFEDEQENEIMEERRHNLSHLSEEELQNLIDASVAAAFDKSIDKLILEISKGFFKKLIWGVVLALLGLALGKHWV